MLLDETALYQNYSFYSHLLARVAADEDWPT
jgi:hypothetical protein